MSETAKKAKMTRNSFDNEIPESNSPETSRCDPVKGDTCSPCKEGVSLDRKIHEMEKALFSLKAMRSSNNSKINTVHDSLSRLPVELVSNIFMYLRPLPMETDYPFSFNGKNRADVARSMKNLLLLGAICRAWRSLAWSLPQLWTTISVNLYNEHEGAPDVIDEWLERSDELPLNVYLYTARRRSDVNGGLLSPHPDGNEPYIEKLTYPIKACSKRWLYLNLNIPKRFMQRVYCNNLDAPMLETLTLQLVLHGIEDPFVDSQDPADRICLGETPNLRKVSLYGLAFDDVTMDWESVTNVYAEGSDFPIALCSDLLRGAPSLTHLTLENLGTDAAGLPTLTFRHQSLTCLHINGRYWDQDVDIFLSYFDFPALEDLSVFASHGSRLDTLETFLRRSVCTLKKFQVQISDNWMENKEQLIALLGKMPSLEILELECEYYDESEFDGSAFTSQFPTQTTIQQMKSIDDNLFLPNLKEVHVKVQYDLWSCSLDLLLYPGSSNTAFPIQSDDNHIIPSGTLYFKPLYVYYLLNPTTLDTIQIIIERGSSKFMWANLHPIANFLRQHLHRFTYDNGVHSSS